MEFGIATHLCISKNYPIYFSLLCCIRGAQLIPAFVLSLARTSAMALGNVFIVTVSVEGYQVCTRTIECER